MIEFLKRHPFPVRSVYRRAYLGLNPLLFPTIHVNEFPKSGGTWLCRMLRDCLDWRLDDNAYPLPGKAVVKHHRIRFPHLPTVTVVRDPRDVAVSYYHHCRRVFAADGFNRNIVALMRERVFDGCSTPEEELAAFVEMMVEKPISPAFTWGDFYRSGHRRETVLVRYEDMRSDPAATLTRIFENVGQTVDAQKIAAVVDSHDISKILQQRTDTSAAHFVRKGEVGGWRRDLTPKSVALIERDAGALLDSFGYA